MAVRANNEKKIAIKDVIGKKVKMTYYHRDRYRNADEEIVGIISWRNGLPGIAGIALADGTMRCGFLKYDFVLYKGPNVGDDLSSYPLSDDGSITHTPSDYDGKRNGAFKLEVLSNENNA